MPSASIICIFVANISESYLTAGDFGSYKRKQSKICNLLLNSNSIAAPPSCFSVRMSCNIIQACTKGGGVHKKHSSRAFVAVLAWLWCREIANGLSPPMFASITVQFLRMARIQHVLQVRSLVFRLPQNSPLQFQHTQPYWSSLWV